MSDDQYNVFEYVPTVVYQDESRAYATFLVKLPFCQHCKKPMLHSVFPNLDYFVKEQIKRAGFEITGRQFESHSEFGETLKHAFCQTCCDAGYATFTCLFCHQERPSNQVYRAAYEEGICSVCFETSSAKEWEEKLSKLDEDNRYFYSS